MAEKKPSPSLNFDRKRPARTRTRTSVYGELLEAFVKSGKAEALVEHLPTKLASQYMGFRNAVKALGLEDTVEVTRYTKEDELWLVRKDK